MRAQIRIVRPVTHLRPALGFALLTACTAYIDVDLSTTVTGGEPGDTGGTTMDASTSEGSADPTGTEAGETGATRGPERCADVLVDTPDAVDGIYTLHVGGDLARPWEAWCVDMAGTPREYLLLPMNGPDFNFSEFLVGPRQPDTTVKTMYSRVRVDPRTLFVDVGDKTFATTVGQATYQTLEVTSMAYATTMGCVDPGVDMARGNVDLRGTPFRVWASQWTPRAPSVFEGGAVASAEDQVIELSASGDCAYMFPGPFDSPNPTNDWGGFYLLLLYSPVVEPTRSR